MTRLPADDPNTLHRATNLQARLGSPRSAWAPLCGYDPRPGVVPQPGDWIPVATINVGEVDCDDCLTLMGRDAPLVGFPLPIDRVAIDGQVIHGEQFEMGSLVHDIDRGTVTVTFCNVRVVDVIYKHMLPTKDGQP